jgi:protein gp37
MCNNYFNNVWIGTSVENQEAADKRIPELLKVPATVRFLSCEPLLGPLDLTPWLGEKEWTQLSRGIRVRQGPLVDWVIAGGESGPKARPVHEDWARSLRDQCQAANIPYFWKQWGQWLPASQRPDNWYNSGDLMLAADKQTPGRFIRLASKHAAGRQLDGREWNEMPEETC